MTPGQESQSVVAVDAADVRSPAGFTTREFPLVVPRAEAEDKGVIVQGRDLARCRELARRVRDGKSSSRSVYQTLLGVGLGGILGGIVSQLNPLEPLGFGYYVVTVGLAAYSIATLRAQPVSEVSAKESAQAILETLPDPDDTVSNG